MIMRPIQFISFFVVNFFLLTSFCQLNAQIRIGGQIDINIGLPEIVVINRAPKPAPTPRKRRPVIVRERIPTEPCNCEKDITMGTIINQNNGVRFDYNITNASLRSFPNDELDLVLNFDTGDVMVVSMIEANPNDCNFHFSPRFNRYNNTIYNITLNGKSIALNSGAVSLQYNGYKFFNVVLNLHSKHFGNYNGTINGVN